ncbi:LacI family transcriptional regulator [Alteromonas mediterranea]|uniref:LacI family DNA-binding transcriptional regulator n=1 Tax=Alteromonas mediterranea TaxID=314275 RepID=UPI0009030BC6|nr:LacI family DNA-binding transcriptional regulator [Alteromonas mediterranea]APD94476.1 LacI family transcriptional regulator [Alteromonas mediterranea]APD98108.1 LacI family transcriptional regulator [Alteromonas mediterranea]APE02351.1 LacI family transcriptional regulator [Alteromonas mediterranea]QDG38866.1 LacI family DNA-binding transcriptional regulator [Alteromonas mediterranea]QGX62231.1 LacI family DNA-binding transcriptional regulator [Alteromonas mediterranea]
MNKRPTINDVAALAGVSKRTVSRVINGATNVGKATRERIEAVIQETGFAPDKQARGLSTSRSYLIGLIYDNPDALYIDQVQRGVLSVCSQKGYELVVHPCRYNSEGFVEDCINFVRRSNIDGVIILPPVSESKVLADTLQQKNINYVRMASVDLDDHQNIVVSDDRAALSDLARYMVSLGHKDIGIISGPQQYYSSKERLEGFIETLNGLGVDVPENRVIEGRNSFESGIECARQLLIQTPRVKAIFANNDEMAAGVLKVAHEMGITVPDQLSVAGFDDNLLAARVIPALTTVQRPVGDMAAIAARKIIAHIEGSEVSETETYLVKPHLIIRDSIKKV